MAYNTAEERHAKQNSHEGSFSLENRLRTWCRDNLGSKEAAYQMVQSAGIKSIANIMITVARDYDAEVNEHHDDAYYEEIAYKVINEYFRDFNNNDNTDDRGKRLGKSWKTVTDTLSNFRY